MWFIINFFVYSHLIWVLIWFLSDDQACHYTIHCVTRNTFSQKAIQVIATSFFFFFVVDNTNFFYSKEIDYSTSSLLLYLSLYIKIIIFACLVLLCSRKIKFSLFLLLVGVGIASVTDLQLNFVGTVLSLLAIITTCIGQIVSFFFSPFFSLL